MYCITIKVIKRKNKILGVQVATENFKDLCHGKQITDQFSLVPIQVLHIAIQATLLYEIVCSEEATTKVHKTSVSRTRLKFSKFLDCITCLINPTHDIICRRENDIYIYTYIFAYNFKTTCMSIM